MRFRRGQASFIEGDRAERVFVVERGWVMIISVASDGREIVLGLRGPGDVIGDLSALDGAPRSATALALGEVEATTASGSTLLRALRDHGSALELLRVLAARLRDADRKRLEFATLDTLGRVAWRLQELSERFGRETADGSRSSFRSHRSSSQAGAEPPARPRSRRLRRCAHWAASPPPAAAW